MGRNSGSILELWCSGKKDPEGVQRGSGAPNGVILVHRGSISVAKNGKWSQNGDKNTITSGLVFGHMFALKMEPTGCHFGVQRI